MKKVSILIPCYNEEESLPVLYDELKTLMDNLSNYDWELLFVNDGSKDNTINVIQALRRQDWRVCYVDLSRNFGKENAMLAGFDYVTGDCMVILDADLQHPPSLIPEMLKYWEEGYDDVYAKRNHRGEEGWLRKQMSLLFYRILSRLSRIEIPQNVGDFRLLDYSCIVALRELRETERYTKGLYAYIGFKKKEIPYKQEDRVYGKTSWNFKRLFGLAINGITSFSTVPLKLSVYLGVIIALISFTYLMFVLFKTIFYGEPVQGYSTIVTLILFLGGLQLLSIGIIGEYLGRIFIESKRRPPYIVREYNDEKVLTREVMKARKHSTIKGAEDL